MRTETQARTAHDLTGMVAAAGRWKNLTGREVIQYEGGMRGAFVPFAVFARHREAEQVIGHFIPGDEDRKALAVIHALDRLNLLLSLKVGQRVAVTRHRQRRAMSKLDMLAKQATVRIPSCAPRQIAAAPKIVGMDGAPLYVPEDEGI
jgi:hypothetical protein